MSDDTRWWGIYNVPTDGWRTENQRSNFDDFVGRLIFYPSRAIAEAHRQMLIKYWPELESEYEVREFVLPSTRRAPFLA